MSTRFGRLAPAIAMLGATHCASPPDTSQGTRIRSADLPDLAAYAQHVHPFIENRCGSLDCHGHGERGMRVYGRRGFRLVAADGGFARSNPTSETEKRDTYESLLAIEPEEIQAFVAEGAENPTRLLFMRKPLALERHKGGHVIAYNDAGYTCLVAWLKTTPKQGLAGADVERCQLAAAQDAR